MVDEHQDDSSIADNDQLWRRIPPRPPFFVADKNLGVMRVSSAAFEDHPNGTAMSVGIRSVAIQHSRTVEDLVEGHEGFGVAALQVETIRKLNQGIKRDPLENQPEHGEVFDKNGKRSRKTKQRLAKAAEIIIEPQS